MEGFEDDDDCPLPPIPVVKMLLLGSARTGKTSLINSYIQHSISDSYEPTQGYAPHSVEVKLHYTEVAHTKIKQEIWDTSGNSAFQRLLESYYRSAKAVMMVFDPAVSGSFAYLGKMVQLVPAAKAYLVVGHRIEQGEEVSLGEIDHFCCANKLRYLEANAATGCNVLQAFSDLSREALGLHP